MDEKSLRHLLEQIQNGSIEVDEAVARLRSLPYENVEDFARLDQHRSLRCGFPEVVFGERKTPEQIIKIVNLLAERNDKVLVTRLAAEIYYQIQAQVPADAIYHESARLLVIDRSVQQDKKPGVMVITAGTADIPVAEEARITAEVMGSRVDRLYDVGVAGLHRLLDRKERLFDARVIIVVAGMDGVLPSVVGGLVSGPVIAVPTSRGYGASFGGLSALLTMLNSCAAGVGVMNIDNGFGAGCLAHRINTLGLKDGTTVSA